MAQIIINIPDADLPRVVDAFADTFDYDRYVREGGTLTKNQFAKSQLIRWMRGIVRAYETRTQQAPPPVIVDPDYT